MFPGDSPSGTPRKYHYVPVRLDRSDDDEYCEEAYSEYSNDSGVGEKRANQTVFDLSLTYSDEDELFDWRQHAALRRIECCGLDCIWIRSCLPCRNFPPDWWFSLSRKKRKLLQLTVATVFFAIVAAIFGGLVLYTLSTGSTATEAAKEPGGTIGSEVTTESGGSVVDEVTKEIDLCNWNNYDLPSPYYLKPSFYKLSLVAEMEEPFSVTGHEVITLDVYEDTKCFVLHALDMDITSVTIQGSSSTATLSYNADLGQYIIKFDQLLPKPEANVSVSFNYTLNDGLSGFYRSSYTVGDGNTYTLATTQFESTAARQAFPCFDEPRFKARFDVTLVVPVGLVALSNMPETHALDQHMEVAVPPGFAIHRYQVTPPMSTYLVAFVVGNLSCVSTEVPCPFPDASRCPSESRGVSVWGTPDRYISLSYALDVASKVLVGYELTLGVPFALPKLDLVAIPDFAAGAMENWGLITFRETSLLITPGRSGVSSYRMVGLTIAHEVAHMWFGDLVTMGQWGELWLNEGFASYFEYVGATIAEPSMEYFDTFYVDAATDGLEFDAKNASHPLSITQGVVGDDKIDALFDSVMYEKGGSLLRMLRAYVNAAATQDANLRRRLLQQPDDQQDPFMAVLGSYLRNYTFGLVTAEKLWGTFSKALEQPVDDWMYSWTYRQGYPLVTVQLGGPDNNDIFIKQAGFQMHGGLAECNSSTAWWVPLAMTAKSVKQIDWQPLKDCQAEDAVYQLKGSDDWVKINSGQFGFYRVQYPPELLTRLQAAFTEGPTGMSENGMLTAIDYAGLLEDSYALAMADVGVIEDFLGLTKSLMYRNVPDYQTWAVTVPKLKKIMLLVPCPDQWQAFVRDGLVASWLRNTIGTTYAESLFKIEMDDEDTLLRLLRPLMIDTAGWFEYKDIAAECTLLVRNLASGGISIDPDIAEQVFNVAVRGGDEDSYAIMVQMYHKATAADEKDRYLNALSYTTNPRLINDTLHFALHSPVRSQDAPHLVTAVARQGGTSLTMAWEFVRTNYRNLWNKFGGDIEGSRALGSVLTRVASMWSSEDKITELHDLFDGNKDILDEVSYVEQAEENIAANKRWVESHGNSVCRWLEDNG